MNSTMTNSTLPGSSESSPALLVLVISFLAIHFVVGFSLNCFTLCLLLLKGRQVEVSVPFTLNHAAAELIYSSSPLMYIALYYTNNLKIQTLSTSAIPLDLFQVSSMSARLLFPCCVCLERYLAVVHPVTFLRFKPLRYRVACSVCAWVCALGLGMLAYTWQLSSYKLLIPVNIVISATELFCCAAILKQLRHPGPRDGEPGKMSATKRKAFQIISLNLLTSLIQNIPVTVTYCLSDVVSPFGFRMALFISTTVNVLTGFVQPVFILRKAGKLSGGKCSC